ncbi:DNA replication and repair protein RecF [Candidatus Bealeia paramacronuclearis]|uniref:DNA replication and repair protein RecF n=1 Tax=Candidatus Bealeia paramacronuclearis TaxID=1921001 RepID=A0ABZ2C7S7_9PROT|nr:DNA replication and repair protein RecF [Candidatus Bealeia paramacronuclearis]
MENDLPLRGLTSLKLTHFRCYASLALNLNGGPVILTGANGAGKTNILEAVSFFIPGRGLRRAKLKDVVQQGQTQSWAVSAILHQGDYPLTLGTGLEALEGHSERRVVKIDGKKISGQAPLTQHLNITWLTPQMDRLFSDGASQRRKFLDRLVYGFDPGHAGRVNQYEHALRERRKLLIDRRFDPFWLGGLEETIVSQGVAILVARYTVVRELNIALQEGDTYFPEATLFLEGELESFLETHSALETEDYYKKRLMETRRLESETGSTPLGPHKSDLVVIFTPKGQHAAFCSTGEQKALLLSIIMASSRLLSARKNSTPLLLLDEVIAHLDISRRSALFHALISLNMQVWLTGTDAALFAELQGSAQFFQVHAAQVQEM